MAHNSRLHRYLAEWEPDRDGAQQGSAAAPAMRNVPSSLKGLSSESVMALKRLVLHRAEPDTFPMKRRAAVMVGLFASRHGHLNVLLTRRSKTMRTYAGETALPGGKMEARDRDLEETARREAFEECGITLDHTKVRKLATLSPFLTRGNIIVTPIVFWITDQTLMPRINKREVDVLFSHRLESLLGSSRLPSTALDRDGITPHSSAFPPATFSRSYQYMWFSTNVPYRLFEFKTKYSPIVGFTADVLLEVATVAYGREPNFPRKAPGQLSMSELIHVALAEAPEFQTDDRASSVGKHDILEDGDRSQAGRLLDNFQALRFRLNRWLGDKRSSLPGLEWAKL